MNLSLDVLVLLNLSLSVLFVVNLSLDVLFTVNMSFCSLSFVFAQSLSCHSAGNI